MNSRRDKQKAARTELNRQLTPTATQPQAKRSNTVVRKLGDFFIDVAKLIIGGVILAGLMKQDIDYWTLATIGIGAVLGFIAIGLTLIKLSDK